MLRSPHIDRKSREQFEIRTHKRLIDILQPTGKTIEALNKGLSLPPGVDIKIRVLSGGDAESTATTQAVPHGSGLGFVATSGSRLTITDIHRGPWTARCRRLRLAVGLAIERSSPWPPNRNDSR